MLRSLSDSTFVQTKANGTLSYPVRTIDNRPEYMRTPAQPTTALGGQPHATGNQESAEHMGDVLFFQPAHLTEPSSSSSSTATATERHDRTTITSHINMSDLHDEAVRAVRQNRLTPPSVEDGGHPMRSAVREGDTVFDVAWTSGMGPPTLPPPIPLAANAVITLKGNALGTWRGYVWSPQPGDTIRHPTRDLRFPTIVAYKALRSSGSSSATIASGVRLTLRPVGDWVAVTRMELSSARTPRYWLAQIEHAPDAGQGEVPLRAGETFFPGMEAQPG